jgi:hydroxyacylglutathione hydrolase
MTLVNITIVPKGDAPMDTQVTLIPIFNDNYIWVIYNSKLQEAIAVDPGEAQPLIDFLKEKQLKLKSILITHHHPDHVGGIKALQQHYHQQLSIYGPTTSGIEGITHPLTGNDILEISAFDLRFQLIHTPGHTLDHLCYYSPTPMPWLFCGDTLFSAGCGRLFEGTAEQMYHSLSKFKHLPAETQVFCTHEYTTANLHFAAIADPENQDIRQHQNTVAKLRAENKPSLPSTLALERKINPFLRADKPSLQASAQKHTGQNISIGPETFAALRSWKDIS